MTTTTILDQTTHTGDGELETVTGEKYQGDGYYGRSDGLHTVQYKYTGFSGTVVIQATLAIDPTSEDWFDVYTSSFESESSSKIINFTGNYVWIRATVSFTDGTINSISLNH